MPAPLRPFVVDGAAPGAAQPARPRCGPLQRRGTDDSRGSRPRVAVRDLGRQALSHGRPPLRRRRHVFGFVGGTLCAVFDTPLRTKAEAYPNLRDYCTRLTQQYFPIQSASLEQRAAGATLPAEPATAAFSGAGASLLASSLALSCSGVKSQRGCRRSFISRWKWFLWASFASGPSAVPKTRQAPAWIACKKAERSSPALQEVQNGDTLAFLRDELADIEGVGESVLLGAAGSDRRSASGNCRTTPSSCPQSSSADASSPPAERRPRPSGAAPPPACRKPLARAQRERGLRAILEALQAQGRGRAAHAFLDGAERFGQHMQPGKPLPHSARPASISAVVHFPAAAAAPWFQHPRRRR